MQALENNILAIQVKSMPDTRTKRTIHFTCSLLTLCHFTHKNDEWLHKKNKLKTKLFSNVRENSATITFNVVPILIKLNIILLPKWHCLAAVRVGVRLE